MPGSAKKDNGLWKWFLEKAFIPILVALIGTGVVGNLFIRLWSQGKFPEFVRSGVFQHLDAQYQSKILNRLDDLFLKPTEFFVNQEVVLKFTSIGKDGKLAQESVATTLVKNFTDHPMDLPVTLQWDRTSQLRSVEVRDENGKTTEPVAADKIAECNAKPEGDLYSCGFSIPLKPGETVHYGVVFDRKVPLELEDDFITSKTVLEYYSVSVEVAPALKGKFDIHFYSLGYESVPQKDHSNVGCLQGPVFPGNGILVSWAPKGRAK